MLNAGTSCYTYNTVLIPIQDPLMVYIVMVSDMYTLGAFVVTSCLNHGETETEMAEFRSGKNDQAVCVYVFITLCTLERDLRFPPALLPK